MVGRNEEENEKLKKLRRSGDYLIELAEIPGPTVLARPFGGKINEEGEEKAKQLVLKYAPKAKGGKVSFSFLNGGKN